MWTNTAFNIYMGQHDAVTAAEFEPARRREVLLGELADSRRGQAIQRTGRLPRLALDTLGLTARIAGRRPVRG